MVIRRASANFRLLIAFSGKHMTRIKHMLFLFVPQKLSDLLCKGGTIKVFLACEKLLAHSMISFFEYRRGMNLGDSPFWQSGWYAVLKVVDLKFLPQASGGLPSA